MSNRGSKKRGKSSEFDTEDDGHIKSGPVVKAWSHEGFMLTSKIAKKRLLRPKMRCPTRLQIFFLAFLCDFWWFFEVRIKPSCDHTFTAGPDLMCPSSWALNSDDFPCFWILYCSSRTWVTVVWRSINICWNFSRTRRWAGEGLTAAAARETEAINPEILMGTSQSEGAAINLAVTHMFGMWWISYGMILLKTKPYMLRR